MKFVSLLLLVVFCLSQNSFGQINPTPPQKMSDLELGNFYQQKSRKLRTTGFILLGAGFAGVIGGAALLTSDWNSNNGSGGGLLYLAGSASMIASIPVFIHAAKNKGRAEILLRYENVPMGYHPASSPKIPAVGFKLPLGKK